MLFNDITTEEAIEKSKGVRVDDKALDSRIIRTGGLLFTKR